VHERTITLPAKEYDLLAKLATEPERVFTKEQLLREVWGYLSLGRTRTLDSHASRLRRKLRQAGAGPCMVNIWGVGYRLLEPPVSASPNGAGVTDREDAPAKQGVLSRSASQASASGE
jgi:DNA-binding response OmpR family regulator